jgi:GMP synthase (glutamine-hydrolysing)
MILIINVCFDELSEFEFVKPVESILKKSSIRFFTKHYLSLVKDDLNSAEKIIICGTALKDFDYLENIDRFDWLKDSKKPILGICAGIQIIARIFDNDLIEKIKIGRLKVNVIRENKLTSKDEFYSYFLNSKAIKIRKHFDILANSERLNCMFKHKNKEIYGCLFHPEVLNPEIIINFCNLLRG